jgi:hypothetical protein
MKITVLTEPRSRSSTTAASPVASPQNGAATSTRDGGGDFCTRQRRCSGGSTDQRSLDDRRKLWDEEARSIEDEVQRIMGERKKL